MLTLGAWLHDLDPFLVRFSGTFGVRWYGLSYIAGFVAAWMILTHLARRAVIRLSPDQVGDLIIAVILGTLVGGRLGYCVFYRPELLWSFDHAPPWWGVLALHEGGMASHGGMIGVVVACLWIARRNKVPGWHVIDCLCLVGPIGVFFGRVANFINGELLGKIVAPPGAPAPWWSVKYPQELLEGHAPELTPDQQTQLADLLDRVALPNDTLDQALRRLVEAVQAGDQDIASRLEPLISARHASQLYQAFAEGILVSIVLWWAWAKPRRPGVVSAWFLLVYGVGRVLTEFIRLPDAHLAVQRFAGLSRGQWLSVVMVIAGAALLWWCARGTGDKLGGWSRSGSRGAGSPGTG